MQTKKVKRAWHLLAQTNMLFVYVLVLFLLLLARNPYSERVLSANLEPFPDTFHYLVPITNVLSGGSFAIERQGFGSITPSVPPLYSISMLPFFMAHSDVRTFYFANVFLALVSLYLFYLILRRLNTNTWLVFLSLILFATNYYIYWYPQWAMAENLLLPIFLWAVNLFLAKPTTRSVVAGALAAVAMYMTKYAAAPLALSYVVLYSIKLAISYKKPLNKLFGFWAVLAFVGLSSLLFLYMRSGVNHLEGFIGILFNTFPQILGFVESGASGANDWVSAYHFSNNFPRYIQALFGGAEMFLWDYTPILPNYLAVAGLFGLVAGAIYKTTRFFAIFLLSLLLVQTIFLSTFYAVDMRYQYTAIPTLILGITLLFISLGKVLDGSKYAKFVPLAIIFLGLVYSTTNALRIKDQIMLNIRHAEVPWYYKSVLMLNSYFPEASHASNKPVVISPMIPYLIDYYSNGNYDLLPLSNHQEFRQDRHLVWGPGDYSDLHALYKSYLASGRKLYVSTYGLGNQQILHDDFNNLFKTFILKEVQSECHELCRLYLMTPNTP